MKITATKYATPHIPSPFPPSHTPLSPCPSHPHLALPHLTCPSLLATPSFSPSDPPSHPLSSLTPLPSQIPLPLPLSHLHSTLPPHLDPYVVALKVGVLQTSASLAVPDTQGAMATGADRDGVIHCLSFREARLQWWSLQLGWGDQL